MLNTAAFMNELTVAAVIVGLPIYNTGNLKKRKLSYSLKFPLAFLATRGTKTKIRLPASSEHGRLE